MMRANELFVLSWTVFILAGCSSETPSAEASDENEIKTANCPTKFDVAFTDFTFKGDETIPQQGLERERILAVREALKTTRSVTFVGALGTKDSGICKYTSRDTKVREARLYTKNRQTILMLDYDVGVKGGGFTTGFARFYAFPSEYAPSGLTFPPDAKANLFAHVMGTGESLNHVVPIGTAEKTWSEGGAPADAVTLENGAEQNIDFGRQEGEDMLRVLIPTAGATGKVVDYAAAICTVTLNDQLSTPSRTVIDLGFDFELEDGWNGCAVAFTAPGYSAKITAGFSID